jgi:chemotaxis protein histidine kinase CheA
MTFEVTDDGRGIDWDLIRTKAKERGLRDTLPSDLVDVLCHDGVSTRAEVTETSGRGVGMAALKQCVLAMKGRLDVESTSKGTSWFMRFPMTAPTAVNPQPALGSALGGKSVSPTAASS